MLVRFWSIWDPTGVLQTRAPLCLSVLGQGQLGLGPQEARLCEGWNCERLSLGAGRGSVGGLEPRVSEMGAGSPSASDGVVGG